MMLVPFQKETLTKEPFLREEVRYHLLHRISEGELAVALEAADGGALALGNPGWNVWLWVDEARDEAYADAVTRALAEATAAAGLPGITAAPDVARRFVEEVCRCTGARSEVRTHLMAYACPRVVAPAPIPGAMEPARPEHREVIADFSLGFHRDCFHEEGSREQALVSADRLISSGNLYVWVDGGNPVGMAGINHRSARHARIGQVYTPPELRGRGIASALVAGVSVAVLGEGLVPVLYADLMNPHSNKVYRGIGYQEAGAVDEVHFHYPS